MVLALRQWLREEAEMFPKPDEWLSRRYRYSSVTPNLHAAVIAPPSGCGQWRLILRCLMRIAVITETYPPEVNGVALTVQNLVSGMAEDGHDMCWCGRSSRASPRCRLRKPIREILVRGAALPKYPGLRFGFPAGRQLKRLFETSGRMRFMSRPKDPSAGLPYAPRGSSASRSRPDFTRASMLMPERMASVP